MSFCLEHEWQGQMGKSKSIYGVSTARPGQVCDRCGLGVPDEIWPNGHRSLAECLQAAKGIVTKLDRLLVNNRQDNHDFMTKE